MKTTVFKVEGMHCPKCVEKVNKAVGKLAGVQEANANLEQKNVTVQHDGRNGIDESIIRAIEALEFSVAGE